MKELQDIISSIISVNILPLCLSYYMTYKLAKITKIIDNKKSSEQKMNILIIQSLGAQSTVAKAMCEALKTGKVNGNIDEAIDALNQIDKEINNYIVDRATQK